MALLSDFEIDVLMEMQYSFPLTETPYCDVAARLGVGVDKVIGTLRNLSARGILKRIGFYLNYRSEGRKAALIAYSTGGDESKVRALAEVYLRDPLATHVYLRDHPVYDVWVVTKRNSQVELEAHAASVAEKLGVRHVLLYSRRTFKLSVKYDLRLGISRSGPFSRVHPSPPKPEEMGYTTALARALKVLPLEERPYRRAAMSSGLSEAEVVEAAREMLRAGILGDPGAALDGHKAGFTENAMVVMEPDPGREVELCECVSSLPFSTHVVLRESSPPGVWRHTCYFMVHAVSRSLIEEVIDNVRRACGPRDVLSIRSIVDLKPGVVR
jgi:DNA-binding Lrp family transcriptional regulator